MAPVAKRARTEEMTDRAKLKPSQVTQTSNIFGPTTTTDDDNASNSENESASALDMDEEEEEEENDDESDMGDEFELEADDDSEDEDEAEDDENDGTTTKKRKKNDPADFSLAMQKILSSGLTLANRQNPILARSVQSKKLDEAAAEERLESKVRHQMTLEKRAALDKGHNATVLGTTDEEVARTIERERGMRKIAQRGVVKLFNAIRASQVSAQDGDVSGTRDERTGLRVRQGAGVKKREVKAQETSKSAFLDMIKSGASRKSVV